jgi:hypothetical protein
MFTYKILFSGSPVTIGDCWPSLNTRFGPTMLLCVAEAPSKNRAGLQSRSRRLGLETYPTSRLVSDEFSNVSVSSRSRLLRSTRDLAVLVAAIANSNCNETLSINLYQLYSSIINRLAPGSYSSQPG